MFSTFEATLSEHDTGEALTVRQRGWMLGDNPEAAVALWQASRSGAYSGRGYRYQDAVGAHILILGWARGAPIGGLIPEGFEDLSFTYSGTPLHAQVRSRSDHRSDMTIGALTTTLAEVWQRYLDRYPIDAAARPVLIVERGVPGLPESGMDRPIADVKALGDAVRADLRRNHPNLPQADSLVSQMRLLIAPALGNDDLALIGAKLGLPAAACVPYYLALKDLVGDAEDSNARRTAVNPVEITLQEVEAVVGRVQLVTNPELIEAPIRKGLCEVVDFITPVHDPRFYEGLDVVPGHVVAGLPEPRPELVDEVVRRLINTRVAIITGPSGAGKSALAWLSAFDTRHAVTWYRVKRLGRDHVEELVRLAPMEIRTGRALVGFVVDNLGREETEGWDLLVAEAAQRPNIALLGAAREEDLGVLARAPSGTLVRPMLDRPLAERIFSGLVAEKRTTWADWHEPFELAQGLVLEYGHILTLGSRLRDTIAVQVDQRIRERREDELAVLRVVSAVGMWDGVITADHLGPLVGLQDERLRQALTRLINEHLVKTDERGRLAGLHSLRSTELFSACHVIPPPAPIDSMAIALRGVDVVTLQSSIAHAFARPEDDDVLLQSVAQRVAAEPTPDTLLAAMQGLRLASIKREAAAFLQIMTEAGVPRYQMAITAQMAVIAGSTGVGTDLPVYSPAVKTSIDQMIASKKVDLRASLMRLLDPELLPSVLARADTSESVTQLLASLIGLTERRPTATELARVGRVISQATFREKSRVLAVAADMDRPAAIQLAAEAGGEQALLAGLEAELDWVRDVRLGDHEGKVAVHGTYRLVAPSVQTNAHEATLEACRLAMGCAPSAEIGLFRAVDVRGRTAGYGGVTIADTRIDRWHLPTDAVIASNRARIRLLSAEVSARNWTERLATERSLLQAMAKTLPEVSSAFVRRVAPSGRLGGEIAKIRQTLADLAPRPLLPELQLSAVSPGEIDDPDPFAEFAFAFVDVVEQMFEIGHHLGPIVRHLIVTMPRALDRLAAEQRWQYIGGTPAASIEALRGTARDTAAVVGRRWSDEQVVTRATKHLRHKKRNTRLRDEAKEARQQASRVLARRSAAVVQQCNAIGIPAAVSALSSQTDEEPVWPTDEVAVLVDEPLLIRWLLDLPKLAEICRREFEVGRQVWIAPRRNGWVVASLGVKLGTNLLSPGPLPAKFDGTPWPFLLEPASDRLRQLGKALEELSGIATGAAHGDLKSGEMAAASRAKTAIEEADAALAAIQESDDSGLVQTVRHVAVALGETVNRELVQVKEGEERSVSLAENFLKPVLENEMTPEFDAYLTAMMALEEFDVDPSGAWDRHQQGLALIAAAAS